MDKIKNIINPGSKKDDDVMYGSGTSSDQISTGTTGATTGHGSHLGSSTTGANNPLSSSTNPTSSTTSGLGSNTSTGPLGSSMAGTTTSGMNNPSSTSRMPMSNDAASTTSIKSGVEGVPHSGSALTGSSGINDPLDTNKPLPREPATAGSELTGTSGSGLTGSNLPDRGVGSSGLGNTSSAVGDSHLGRDAALGAGAVGAAGAAHHHHDRERDTLGSDSGRSFPLGGNSSSNMGSGYPSTTTGSTTAGPHSSNLANKADPRVDSDLDGSRNMGATGLGSGTGSSVGTTHQGHLGRDATVGAGAVSATGLAEREFRGDSGITSSGVPTGAGYGPESWEHDHSRHGHQFEGDPCGPEAHVPGPHFTKGPHATDTANLLDPHVASSVVPPSSTSGSGTTPSTTGTGVGSTGTGSSHLGRDTALAGGVGAAGVGAYEAGRGSSDNTVTSGGLAPNTAGPHKSDLLNKLDPRVDSDRSKQQGTSGTTGTSGIGTTSTTGTSNYPSTSSTTGRDHHLGRDAGLVGAGGVAAYEADKHHHNKDSHLTGNSGTGITGNSGTGISGNGGTGPNYSTDSAMRGSGITAGTGTPGTTSHHLGRDAGLAGAGAGAAYEAEKHHGHHYPSGTTASGYEDPYPSSTGTTGTSSTAGSGLDNRDTTGTGLGSQTGTGHHYGRDAGLAGAGGVAAYEAEKHHHNKHDPATTTSSSSDRIGGISSDRNQPTSTGHHYGRDAGLAGAGGAAAYEAEKHHHNKHDPTATTSPSSDRIGGISSDRNQPTSTGHHYGRDAGLAGAGGAAAYEAEKHHNKHDPMTTVDPSTHGDHHKGRDAAVAGGIGAAGGAEFSKKEAEKLQKEQEKEHKKHVKEEVKHQKEHEKHEKHDEKKHGGGLLGKIFHHDKADKETRKEENLEREGLSDSKHHGHHHGTETAAGVGAAGAAGVGLTEAEKHQQAREHDRNRLHKDPPAGLVPKTEYAEAPQSGYASQVTGGTGTTALAQGESVDRGSHLSGIGNKLDPNVAGRGDNVTTGPDGRAIEPHTGLAIDLSKGTGAGGTDNNTPIHGFHDHNRGTGTGSGTGSGSGL